MAAVLAAMVLGQIGLVVDSRIGDGLQNLPLGLTSTVQSARAVLSTIAGATITFAGIAFSVSLLVIQLGSSQYSPRIVHTLFRDPFNRRVMALVVGTFTFCLVVLRSVRSPLEDGGDPVVPNLSVAVAVVLGISAILSIVGLISHNAHAMDISKILEQTSNAALERIRSEWHDPDGATDADAGSGDVPDVRDVPEVRDVMVELGRVEPGHVVRFDRTGWVQQIDVESLLRHAPAATTVSVETYPGRYAITGAPLATLTPRPREGETLERLERHILAAVVLGNTRTLQQDLAYGLRQLVDVALKALSPGVNDPTTAQDAMFHAGAVLAEFLRRLAPPVVRVGEEGRAVVLRHQPTHDELIALTFDEVRRVSSDHPTVCIYLLEILELLLESLDEERAGDHRAALHRQARLVLEGCEMAGPLAVDLDLVREAYEKRFEPA